MGAGLDGLSTSTAVDGKSICFEWEGTEPGGFSQRALGREVWPEKNGVYVIHWKAVLVLCLSFKMVWEHRAEDSYPSPHGSTN